MGGYVLQASLWIVWSLHFGSLELLQQHLGLTFACAKQLTYICLSILLAYISYLQGRDISMSSIAPMYT